MNKCANDYKANNQEWLRAQLPLSRDWLRHLNYPEWDDETDTEAVSVGTCEGFEHLVTLLSEECDFSLFNPFIHATQNNRIEVAWYATESSSLEGWVHIYVVELSCGEDDFHIRIRLPEFEYTECIDRIGPVVDILVDALRKLHEIAED